MGEVIVRIIFGLIEAALEILIPHTGRFVLARFGRKPNPFVEGVVGLLIWVSVAILIALLIVAMQGRFAGRA